MIGLSLDLNSKTPPGKTGKTAGLDHGFPRRLVKNRPAAGYGVEGIPAIFLIAPDGKILAKDLRGKAIQSAVEHALAKTANAK